MAPGEPEEQPASPPRRINVAVTPDMLAALDRVMEREQVTLTEAVRRLIGYGDFLYRTVKQDGQSIILRGEDGGERGILLV
jgi:hypothetical protein